MRTAFWFFLAFLLVASPAMSQSSADNIIVPGERIGKWNLRMTIPDLERMNGSASHRVVAVGQEPYINFVTNFTIYDWSSGFAAVSYDEKHVECLIAGSHGIPMPQKTVKGIGVQGNRGDVVRAYGKPTAEVRTSRADMMTIYDKIGIAFRIDNDGSLSDIWIFRPGSAKRIWKW